MSGAGQKTSEKENVVTEKMTLEAGDCTVTLLPRFGGKIASIQISSNQVKGRELLQAPLSPIAPRTQTMSFDAADASGWDECLPSVANCVVPFNGAAAQVPDHGDLWRVEWTESREEGTGNREQKNSVTLVGRCFSLPLELTRKLTLTETKAGWSLSLDYTVTNTGEAPAPWSWAAHPLFVAEEGDRIVLPGTIQTLRLEGSGGNRLGKNGDAVSWPIARLATGGETDLSIAQKPDSGIGDKLFTGPLTAAENWCELIRPSAGVKIRVSFDPTATPYLGLWICYGGWPDDKDPARPGPKQVCVALEPATAPVDSLAVTGPWSRTLEPHKWFTWPMRVEIDSL